MVLVHFYKRQEKLYLIQNKLQKQSLTCIRLDLPLKLFIFPSLHSPTGLLAQLKHRIKWIYTHFGEGNGNPLQCSCLENPRDGGAWWAAVYGVAQS